MEENNIPYYILEKDTYTITKRLTPEGKTYCAVCSRLRRGSLYGFAQEIGATKVALGHHRDDIIATFFLNLFHGGSLKAMPPKLLSSDKKNILIRPLAYVEEKTLLNMPRFVSSQSFHVIFVVRRKTYSVPCLMKCYVNGINNIRSAYTAFSGPYKTYLRLS